MFLTLFTWRKIATAYSCQMAGVSVEVKISCGQECFKESKLRLPEGVNNFARKTTWPLN